MVRGAASMTTRRLRFRQSRYPIRTTRTPCYNIYQTHRRMGN